MKIKFNSLNNEIRNEKELIRKLKIVINHKNASLPLKNKAKLLLKMLK